MNSFEDGRVLLVNKPLGWTSADVVKKIRNQVHAKVGHAGTLDPLATGLLILCTGKFTKKISEYMAKEKEYTGTLTLGATTASYDLETTPENQKDYTGVTLYDLTQAVEKLTGHIKQVPPIYSAIKKNGERSYDLARQGREIVLDARNVMVSVFEIEILELPIISFRIVCSTGTYIRSLANDLGAYLNCGAYLSSLCRTRIGEFHLKDAINPEAKEIIKMDN
jgi:tRNA pseudouridine55 synthase